MFTSAQAEYVTAVVRGVFRVFEPKLEEQYLSEIEAFCESCFGQEPYEKIWDHFSLKSDDRDSATAEWFFFR